MKAFGQFPYAAVLCYITDLWRMDGATTIDFTSLGGYSQSDLLSNSFSAIK